MEQLLTHSPAAAQPDHTHDRWRDRESRHGVTIFDLDRTITRRGTYSPFLLFAAKRLAPWRLLLVPAILSCMLGFKLGMMSRKRLKERMHRIMLGDRLPRAVVDRIAVAYADHVLRTNLCPGARSLIARELAEGRTLILATAAHRFYATAIASALGIDRVVGTESVWTGDDLLPAVAGENCYGMHKAAAIECQLVETGLLRSAICLRFYSDDASDLPGLLASDQPIAVNPSSKLARISRQRGWPMLSLA